MASTWQEGAKDLGGEVSRQDKSKFKGSEDKNQCGPVRAQEMATVADV